MKFVELLNFRENPDVMRRVPQQVVQRRDVRLSQDCNGCLNLTIKQVLLVLGVLRSFQNVQSLLLRILGMVVRFKDSLKSLLDTHLRPPPTSPAFQAGLLGERVCRAPTPASSSQGLSGRSRT